MVRSHVLYPTELPAHIALLLFARELGGVKAKARCMVAPAKPLDSTFRQQVTQMEQDTGSRHIHKVSDLIHRARLTLEQEFPTLWVEGEVSNFSQPKSGHWYFTLKDQKAQLRCAMFRHRNQKLGFVPEDGQHVLICCQISLYEARGEFQGVVEKMEVAGEGALRLAFEQLYNRLKAEGLFAEDKKTPIPVFPCHIGVISSITGAAIRDVMTVLARRYPAGRVTVLPASTQGGQAPAELIGAIKLARDFNAARSDTDEAIDLLIIARGGGSLEDLQAFNDEALIRAISACPIAVISGVGHETDHTITDWVADKRAATPSAAAELASPDQKKWQALYRHHRANLVQAMQHYLQNQAHQIKQCHLQPSDLSRRLEGYQQQLDEIGTRNKLALKMSQTEKNRALEHLKGRLQTVDAARILGDVKLRLQHLKGRAQIALNALLHSTRQRLRHQVGALDTLSPLRTLDRGYALVRRAAETITSVRQVATGERVAVFLSDGSLDCKVQTSRVGTSITDTKNE